MALFLRTEQSCYPDTRISKLFSSVAQKKARVQASTQSDYQAHREKEVWNKLRNEKGADLVLVFGEGDVRVFKRKAGKSDDISLEVKSVVSVEDVISSYKYQPGKLSAFSQGVTTTTTKGGIKPLSPGALEESPSGTNLLNPPERKAGTGTTTVTKKALANMTVPQRLRHMLVPIEANQDVQGIMQEMSVTNLAMSTKPTTRKHNERTTTSRNQPKTPTKADNVHPSMMKPKRARHHRQACELHPTNIKSKMHSRLFNAPAFPKRLLKESNNLVRGVSRGGDYVELVAPLAEVMDPFPILTVQSQSGSVSRKSGFSGGDSSMRGGDDSTNVFLTETMTRTLESHGTTAHVDHYLIDNELCNCTPRSTSSEEDDEETVEKTTGVTSKVLRFQTEVMRSRTSMSKALEGSLKTRSNQRKVVCRKAERIKDIIHEAEEDGKDWFMLRKVNTPAPGVGPPRLWGDVYDVMQREGTVTNANSATYKNVLKFCVEIGFPSDATQEHFLLKFRDVMMNSPIVFSEDSFMSLLETPEGKELFTTSTGYSQLILHLRELVGMPKKELLVYILRKPWGSGCQEMLVALQSSTAGNITTTFGGTPMTPILTPKASIRSPAFSSSVSESVIRGDTDTEELLRSDDYDEEVVENDRAQESV
eukprot:PhF_6_TR2300/c0_g1_i1/m.4039